MPNLPKLRAIWLATVGCLVLFACGPNTSPPPAPPADCSFLDGNFTAPLVADTCNEDPRQCAELLNACLAQLDFLQQDDLWVLQSPFGAVPVSSTGASSVRALASRQGLTPMHGRYNTVFLNATAAEAFNQQIVRDPEGHFDTASLPYGSVVVKQNFTAAQPLPGEQEKLEGEPWLTVMAKIEGYCTSTIGGNCVGGDWFYYLYRFGDFKQFTDVPVYGKPQAFCTDCHNPVSKADFLWNLHLYVRGREAPYYEDGSGPPPSEPAGALPPADVCAAGALGIGPQPPKDVPLAPSAVPEEQRQAMFDCFSWRTFAALNWPAKAGERGVPASSSSLSDLAPPRVWETFKETAEVFQPEIADWNIDELAWNDTQFVPEACQEKVDHLPAPERAKVMQMITKTRAHQVLNETHQAMGNQFNILVDQAGRLVQYEVRLNRDEFEYLKANGFANTGEYSFEGPKNAEVVFPTNANGFTGQGATEIKAAWRELCSPDTNGDCPDDLLFDPSRYYTQIGLIFTPETRQSEESCRLAKVGLVGLHIIRKTVHSPQWVWATFEHVDNVPPVGEAGRADTQYLLNDPSCVAPGDELCSVLRPGVIPKATEANKSCCPNAQLIVNANPGRPGLDGTLQPHDGQPLVKNQVTRLVPIGPVEMNGRFQAALPPPWSHYLLLNTQWPSGARQEAAQSPPGAVRRIPCNVRDLLWSELGGENSAFLEAGIPKPECYTMQPRSGDGELKLRNTTMETFQAAWDDPATGDAHQVSSQSCFNCHGFSGVDFSFVWTDATEEIVPFPPAGGSTGP